MAPHDRTLEEIWALRRDAVRILAVIVATWRADPGAAWPVDDATRRRAREVIDRLRVLEARSPAP